MSKHLINIDDKVWQKVKAITSMKDITLNKYVVDSIEQSIKKDLPLLRKFIGELSE